MNEAIDTESMPVSSPNIREIAEAIDRYLENCPKAAETAEAIAQWWLSRQRFNDSLHCVIEALVILEQEGRVERMMYANDLVLYRKSGNV